jgi:hypothetical protein
MGPAMRLTGDAATDYLTRVRSLLTAARAGAHYPDARALLASLSFVGPTTRLPFVEVDERSGLPSPRQLRRVFALHQLAREFFREKRVRRSGRQSHDWLELADAEVARIDGVEAKLVSRQGAGRYLLVADGIDRRTGAWVRHSAWVSRRSGRHLDVDRGNQARASVELAAVMRMLEGASAEQALVTIAALEGLDVDEVVRGQLGPLQTRGAPGPQLISEVVKDGGAVLHLALERAGTSVEKDRIADPWHRREAEPGEHHVACERRLVCTPDLDGALRESLRRERIAMVVRCR